jgi:tRNA (guanine37-N1)-methyltransferase
MIASYSNPKIVYAIDKNKFAIDFLKQNIKKNNVLDKVEALNIDSKDIHKNISCKADRIIMNLPFSAYNFFKYALKIANKICVIHYYDILSDDKIQNRIKDLKKIAINSGFVLSNLDVRKIKTYAPREYYIGIDIIARKTF